MKRQQSETVNVELTKDEAVAIIGAISYATQCDSAFRRNEPTVSGYEAVQAGLRDYFKRRGPGAMTLLRRRAAL